MADVPVSTQPRGPAHTARTRTDKPDTHPGNNRKPAPEATRNDESKGQDHIICLVNTCDVFRFMFQWDDAAEERIDFICSGPETNNWVHRRRRMYLRSKDYFSDFERVYGASGILPSLDGADHFRLRKSMSSAYSRARLMGQLDRLCSYARNYAEQRREIPVVR